MRIGSSHLALSLSPRSRCPCCTVLRRQRHHDLALRRHPRRSRAVVLSYRHTHCATAATPVVTIPQCVAATVAALSPLPPRSKLQALRAPSRRLRGQSSGTSPRVLSPSSIPVARSSLPPPAPSSRCIQHVELDSNPTDEVRSRHGELEGVTRRAGFRPHR